MTPTPLWSRPVQALRAIIAALWPSLESTAFPRTRRTAALIVAGAVIGAGWTSWQARRHVDHLAPPPILPRAIRPIVVTRGALFSRREATFMAPSPCGALALETFLPSQQDPLTTLRGFFGGTWRVDAYTVPGSDTLFLMRPLHSLPDTTFAHEWTHLIQDQYLDLRARYEARATWDEKLALTATVEAVAHVVADDGAWNRVSPYSESWPKNASAFVHEMAPRWVKQAWNDYPLATTAAAPGSTFPILFPTEDATRIAPLPPQGAPTCQDRLGPLAVMTAIYRYSRDAALTERAGRAWRGDAVRSWDTQPARLRWDVTWAPAHRDELAALWRKIVADTGITVSPGPTP